MASTNATQANPRRILIVRLSSMGDVIHGLPAAAMLRQAFPEASLGWLIEERWAELLCAVSTPRSGKRSPERPLVDAIHTAKLKQWRTSLFSTQTWERIAASLSDLRSQQYDIAIDLQGAARSAILARWSGASTIYGATQPRENLASLWYTRKNITHHVHVVEQYAEIAQSVVGLPRPIPEAIFPCDPVAEQVVEKRVRELDLHDFAILNPGAGWGAKQWPAERYGVVAQGLARKGIRSFINFGPGEESLAKLAETASGGIREHCHSQSANFLQSRDALDCSSAETRVPWPWPPRCTFQWWRFSAPRIPRATARSVREASCCVRLTVRLR